MGQPDGGWYDDDPPRIIGSTPADGATGVTAKKVTILFDEYIKMTNAAEKVIVSPPQLEMPEIKEAGKKIVVELKDSLKPNMTYTIDFSDAITDNNEETRWATTPLRSPLVSRLTLSRCRAMCWMPRT